MSFYNKIAEYRGFDFDTFFNNITNEKLSRILSSSRITELDFLALLSEKATSFLESMAQRAAAETKKHFGSCVFIFTPLYISNHCDNKCVYCAFAHQHNIARRQLSFDQIRKESERIAQSGIRHILVLTGESREIAGFEFLRESLSIISEYFSSVAIEVYPLTELEYKSLIDCGVDGLTIYQETYNETLYPKYHCGGPKQDYRFRLETPDRGCQAGMRAVTVGALFGLDNPCTEAFFTGIHAAHLLATYPGTEVSVSMPRIRPFVERFNPPFILDDRHFVQYMAAMRLFLPTAGITVSTRESCSFRDAILPIGVTKMSAGVSTSVGGRTGSEESTAQFEIADARTVDEMKVDLQARGYQPVMHDWNLRYVR